MQQNTYDPDELTRQNSNRFIGDDHLLVKFFTHPKLMRQESEEAQRPIYKETPYIQIMTPGNKDSIIQRPARQMDKDRFPEHWKKFSAREEQTMEGTPLSEVSWVTRSQCEEMKWLNIMTVEQLAALSDTNSQGLMGIGPLKKKAVAYMEKAEKEATGVKMLAQLQERDDQIAALMERVEAMEAEKAPKKRGRPSKKKDETIVETTEE